jgi:hypothetical protein
MDSVTDSILFTHLNYNKVPIPLIITFKDKKQFNSRNRIVVLLSYNRI